MSNIKLTAPNTYTATIGVKEWQGITPDSRFWVDVQDMIDAGAEVVDMTQPVEPTANPKLVGVDFEGVMCSATNADQSGLVAVLMAVQMQGAAFPDTRFKFDNGNEITIGLGNYQQFTAVWLPFRQSFFAV